MGFEKIPQHEGDDQEDTWVLGAPFLRRFYSIFDADHHRIGLVKSRHALEGIGDISDMVPRLPVFGLIAVAHGTDSLHDSFSDPG